MTLTSTPRSLPILILMPVATPFKRRVSSHLVPTSTKHARLSAHNHSEPLRFLSRLSCRTHPQHSLVSGGKTLRLMRIEAKPHSRRRSKNAVATFFTFKLADLHSQSSSPGTAKGRSKDPSKDQTVICPLALTRWLRQEPGKQGLRHRLHVNGTSRSLYCLARFNGHPPPRLKDGIFTRPAS